MREIAKVLLIILEVVHSLVDLRKAKEFDDNVQEIKRDPIGYARRKFGRLSKSGDKVQNSDTDSSDKRLDRD